MADPSTHASDTITDVACSITSTYTNETTTVSFSSTYPLLKMLLAHPPCPHHAEGDWPCFRCETSFTTPFWTAAATLLDYFADFFPTDTPTMQSLWFHLLDVWQSASLHLNIDITLDSDTESEADAEPDTNAIYINNFPGTEAPAEPPTSAQPGSKFENVLQLHYIQRAIEFHTYYEQTITLFHTVLFGTRRRSPVWPPEIIHSGTSCVERTSGRRYEPGPWISGLRPWAQWLSEGSPGVAGCSKTTLFSDDGSTPSSTSASASASASTAAAQLNAATHTRHVPQPAIAIVQKHAQRATRRATALYAHANADANANANTQANTQDNAEHSASAAAAAAAAAADAARLAAFTARSLVFPAVGAEASYTGLHGRQVRYALYNGAPPVVRAEGLLDEDMTARQPGFTLLDECMGVCKGVGGYVAVSGAGGGEEGEGEGEGEGEEDDEGEDEEGDGDGEDQDQDENQDQEDEEPAACFDVWAVREGGVCGEKNELADGLGDMFDDWALLNE